MSDIQPYLDRIERICETLEKLEVLGALSEVSVKELAASVRVDVRLIRAITRTRVKPDDDSLRVVTWAGDVISKKHYRPTRLVIDFPASSLRSARRIALEQARSYASMHPEVASFSTPRLVSDRHVCLPSGEFVQHWNYSVDLRYSETD